MATAAERPPSFGEEVPRHSRLWLPPVPRRRSEANGVASPSAMRTSLQKLSEGRKARRLTFFRNGDRFDKGLVYALSLEKVRTFEALLEDLTRIMVDLPMGVRFIFSEDGREKVSQLEHLCEGCVYVCSSTDHFVRLPYGRQEPPRPHWTLGRSTRGIPGTPSSSPTTHHNTLPAHHGFVRPKLITVIRNGVRPRKAVRVLLNHKTARSFEQVLDDVTKVIKLDSGAVRKVFTLTGKPVALPETVGRLYSVREMLGDGNFATVYQCVSRETGVEYALKIIDKDKCRGKASVHADNISLEKEQMIANEVAILRRVQHPNVVRLVEEFNFDTELYLVMELVKGGDLFDAIAAATKFPEYEASRLVSHLASALAHLHSLHVVHRDIKPENLLVGVRGALKLADFGLATELPRDGSLLSTVCGTPTYVAPEILAETGYALEVDVWAMGVITYILLCGFPPFVSQTNNQDELFDQILSGRFEFMAPYWDGISALAQGGGASRQSDAWQVGLHFEERPRSCLDAAGTLPSAMVLHVDSTKTLDS
ncbi:hypothetical protein HPB51_011071 [Rhipicephalus microplus]|uniref:non-specific serine/threonine protein kinase n=1 Tax=Rhipicephalus microplus TaxID=6941 RepID=A0A9J6DUL3_RHIMP|nr:hypothetical protein HPB51_011071 [Rhipicephalus microplus]